MAIKLYLDEDAMARALADALRERGVDVITTQEVGMAGSKDEEQLRYATSQGRAIYSFNTKDFYKLHTQLLLEGEAHRGIVLAHQGRYSIESNFVVF